MEMFTDRYFIPPMVKFSGCVDEYTSETPLSDFLEEFKFCTALYDFSDKEKAGLLIFNLTGPAREEVKYCLTREEQGSYPTVVKALRIFFGQREDVHSLRTLFYNRVQREGEDVVQFSRNLIRLYTKIIDAADDEKIAQALGQLRDGALSSQFVVGKRDRRVRHEVRRLKLQTGLGEVALKC